MSYEKRPALMHVLRALEQDSKVLHRFWLVSARWASVTIYLVKPVEVTIEWDVPTPELEGDAGHFSCELLVLLVISAGYLCEAGKVMPVMPYRVVFTPMNYQLQWMQALPRERE